MRQLSVFYDTVSGEMYFQEVSSVMWSRFVRPLHQRECEKIIGPTTKRIYYRAAKKFSRDMFFNLYMSFPSTSRKESVKELLDLLSTFGYGVFKLSNFDENRLSFKIVVENSYNALGYENSEKPICYELSGILASLFETVFKREMRCDEKKCRGMKGVNEENCEFYISGGRETTYGEEKEGKKIRYSPSPPGEISKTKSKKFLKEYPIFYDATNGEINVRGVNTCIYPREERGELERELEKVIGAPAGTIFYKVAKIGALDGVKKIINTSMMARFILFLSKNKIISHRKLILGLMKVCYIRGYGAAKLISLDESEPSAVIRMDNCFNTLGYESRAEKSICYSMSGIIAGTGEVIFNRKMRCVEKKCKGNGDEYCEFEVFSSK